MAMIDQLAGGERRRRQFHPVDGRVEPALQEADQVLAGIALAAHRLLVEAAELAFADIGVITFELLLGRKLGAVIRRFFAPLAVLPGTIFAAIERAFRTAPQIDAETPIDLVLRFLALAHSVRFRFS